MPCLLGIDIGTGSVKLGLFDADRGAWVAVSSQSTDASEQDVHACWPAVQSVVSLLRREHSSDFKRIVGISVTGQMRGLIVVGRDGELLTPPLAASDRRARTQADQFLAEFGLEAIHEVTGQRFNTATSAAKLRWLRQEHPAVLDRAHAVLTHKDYIRFRLTGEVATDPTDASGWLLYDLSAGDWHPGLCRFAGLETRRLPPIRPASASAGRLRPDVVAELGLPAEAEVVIGAGDDIAITGAGAHRPGDVGEHIGSTGSVFAVSARPVFDPLRVLECYPTERQGLFWVGGSCNSAGTAIKAGLGGFFAARGGSLYWELVSAALGQWEQEDPSRWPVYLPYVAGERCPIWNPEVSRRCLDWATQQDAPPTILSIYDGVACVLAWIMREVHRLGLDSDQVFSAGQAGGNPGFGRLRATHYGKPVQRQDQPEATLFGAILIAATSMGLIEDVPAGLRRWSRPAWSAEPVVAMIPVMRRRFESFRAGTARQIADAMAPGARP